MTRAQEAGSAPMLTRRHLLGLAAAGSVAWLTPQLAGGPSRAQAGYLVPLPGPLPGEPLRRLPELRLFRGAAGIRTGYLTAARLPKGNIETGALAAQALSYDGTFPGPVIRLREGHPARVIFRNRSGETSNLHLHGLRIPPHVDAPFAHVHAGTNQTYRFRPPQQSAGTYWYHPHLHGSVEGQMERGLVGPIIVDPAHLPAPLAGSEDHLVVLSTRLDQTQVLINGAPSPTLTVQTPMVRLRLINAGVGRTLTLHLRETSGPGAGRLRPLWVVATDGGFVNHPVRVTSLTLGAGERAEVLVDALLAPAGLVTADDGATQLLLTGPGHAQRPPRAGALGHVPLLRPAAGATHRRIVLGQAADGTFRLDGRLFDAGRVDQHVKAGALEVWDIVNTTGVEHPFHVHTWPFQVLRRGQLPEPFAAWRDVVVVQPGQTVRLAIPFTANKGRTVYHCHIAMHEDAGMMGVVQVS
jgi:FtsP/CotA-like multicopper oxidase with cupredoxin domain